MAKYSLHVSMRINNLILKDKHEVGHIWENLYYWINDRYKFIGKYNKC